jgi:hypothetical protein
MTRRLAKVGVSEGFEGYISAPFVAQPMKLKEEEEVLPLQCVELVLRVGRSPYVRYAEAFHTLKSS